MKRFIIFLTVLIFVLLVSALFSDEQTKTIKMRIYPTQFTLHSDIETDLLLELRNTGDVVLSNIKLSVNEEPNILLNIEPLTIDSLNAGSSIYFTIKATPIKTLSKKVESTIITLNADNFENKQKLTFTIRPPKNYWGRIGLFITLFVIILFVVIQTKLKKGEIEND
jgi:uncharacterized membrane protein